VGWPVMNTLTSRLHEETHCIISVFYGPVYFTLLSILSTVLITSFSSEYLITKSKTY
jgi:hypothetical protein